MKLLSLYEDLFQYMCRLNRAARTDAQPEYMRVRSEVVGLLSDIKRNASADVRILNQVTKLELPVIFAIDYLIRTSRLKFAEQWATNSLAREKNELAGDERFFDFLEPELADVSDDAAERLAIYYVFLGFGFMGMYQGRPDQIRKYMEQIFPRIRGWVDSDPRGKISDEAYRCTDSRQLTEPPSNKIIIVALVFAFLTLSAMLIYYGIYASASRDLANSIGEIIKQSGQ
ncbi:MAG TPA: DotU family type IV/VI secretion system protein [Candidatus Dormibacteraeota bacterium]|nr:DotU family type IV/VI secretion system protein [Candidatus Dormibacteraeota bacterium]